MAPSRRRTSRKKISEAAKAASQSGDESGDENVPDKDQENRDLCPACKDGKAPPDSDEHRETWIRCDACKSWFHWSCVAIPHQDHEAVANWFCQSCRDKDVSRVITFKPPARKSARKKAHRDYASLHSGLEADPDKWMKILEGKVFAADDFKRMHGDELTLDWLYHDDNALREPIVIEQPDGLGMQMPPSDFEVQDVADILGRDHPVEVIDVSTQSNTPNWNLGKWADYYYADPRSKDKIRNVISLEISDTELASRITPPRLVREIDWVENFWPATKRGKGNQYPKVQLYCLMGVARAWTDWHVDFAGSSVYYHVLRGAKTFYFIRPIVSNLNAYEKWSGSETQNHVWLGDMVDQVVKVELHQGNTMIIPTGWIHAVHTPENSLVFGGNFLHSYNVATQIRIRDIEINTQVPKKFRFPFFTKLCWYVGEKYLRDLKAKEEFPNRILESIEALANFLVSEARTLEKGGETGKREAREMVPSDKVKDAAAMARELRWRVRMVLNGSSGDEGKGRPKAAAAAAAATATANGTNKRKREHGEVERQSSEQSESRQPLHTKHFKPRDWDVERRLPGGLSLVRRKAARPWAATVDEQWAEWDGEGGGVVNTDGIDEAEVEMKRDVTIRVRQFQENGMFYLERHRAERVLEVWRWPEPSLSSSSSSSEIVVDVPSDELERTV